MGGCFIISRARSPLVIATAVPAVIPTTEFAVIPTTEGRRDPTVRDLNLGSLRRFAPPRGSIIDYRTTMRGPGYAAGNLIDGRATPVVGTCVM